MATDAKPFALIMHNDGSFVLADWTPTTEPHELLRREGIQQKARMGSKRIDDTLTVWSDDNALWENAQVNRSAQRLLSIPHTICGPVVLTGAIPHTCASIADGLTQDQALRLIERHLTGKRVLMRSLRIPAQHTS
ncbi:hypothetical protein [Streptomyces sp. NBC_01443]|uniref:hypothetical protein n=1 Tax=Streptomyces sp. NBC_01443 TaxID=2903868 RepID=UPI002253213E|nr:hypothetical protein [Streptomyces sp. NBC_01443]MCX4633398.1 DUF3846 domain-containing protein [Streptomyces sp. NBC_01443]